MRIEAEIRFHRIPVVAEFPNAMDFAPARRKMTCMKRSIAHKKIRFRLPGWELVGPGLRDLENGVESSVEALIVLIGAPRLRELGFAVPAPKIEMPTHRLYELLAKEDSDSAHYRYNDLVLRLVSFENAAECVS